ncbi:MAG: hypothetical protein HYU39_10060 [Thaumarchaeota archaeon]|nr:hypothetical protein [Nitrososphaerota archaeon]
MVFRIAIYAVLFTVVDVVYMYVSINVAAITFAASSLIAGVFLAAVVSFVFSHLPFKTSARISLAWLCLFIIRF